jgi:hypothetical protein
MLTITSRVRVHTEAGGATGVIEEDKLKAARRSRQAHRVTGRRGQSAVVRMPVEAIPRVNVHGCAWILEKYVRWPRAKHRAGCARYTPDARQPASEVAVKADGTR